jgi:hypothetical protein
MQTPEEKYYEGANVLLAPFRALARLRRLFDFMVLFLIWVGYVTWENTAWEWGSGPYGPEARQTWLNQQTQMRGFRHDADPVYLVLSHRHLGAPTDPAGDTDPAAAFEEGSEYNYDGSLYSSRGGYIRNFCLVAPGSIAKAPWLKRKYFWWQRQTERMERDLTLGEAEVTDLRYVLTRMRLGLPIHHAEGECIVDPSPDAETPGWVRTSASIVIPGTQPITYVAFLDDATAPIRERVYGICLTSAHCDHYDLLPYVNSPDDLFADQPTLSPNQMAAEEELQKTATDAFWIQAAHQNHVLGRDREVLRAAAAERKLLQAEFAGVPVEALGGTVTLAPPH